MRTIKRALTTIVDLISQQHPAGSSLRVQAIHSADAEGADMLCELVDQQFDCTWFPTRRLSLALGAHVGPTMVAIGYAPLETFADEP